MDIDPIFFFFKKHSCSMLSALFNSLCFIFSKNKNDFEGDKGKYVTIMWTFGNRTRLVLVLALILTCSITAKIT